MKTCLITCTYGPDLERCRALCASVRLFLAPDIEHVLVVPRRDAAAARRLSDDPRTRVVLVEDVLPRWIRQVPGQRRWWVTPYSPPVRGWIVQQIVKLSADRITDAEAIVFADSDVQLVRPLGPDDLTDDAGRLRLHRLPCPPGGIDLPAHRRWARSTSDLLGLPRHDAWNADYIAQLACWRRDTLQRLQEHLTQTGGRDWRRTLCRTLHFSEYVIYGVFAEYLMADASGHFTDANDLCHCSWHYQIDTPEQLTRFVHALQPHHRAVLMQSYLPVDAPGPEAYLTPPPAGQTIAPPPPRHRAAETASHPAPPPVPA